MRVPYYKQETCWTCGAAVMRMVLGALGIRRSEKQVIRILRTNKVRGTGPKEIPRLAEHLKLSYTVLRNSSLSDLRELLKKKYLVIVCYHIRKEKEDHLALVKRIGSKKIFLLDPEYGPDHSLPLHTFLKVWRCGPLFDHENAWLIGIRKP